MVTNDRRAGAGPAARKASGWWENLKTIVYAVLIAIGIRSVAFEPFNIPSGSMKPTLLVGDYLFVSKYAYGYSRHSLPWSLPLIPGRILAKTPARGDVAVFKNRLQDNKDFIKRVIGLPGDRIQLRGGILHINDLPVRLERLEDGVELDDFGRRRPVQQWLETLPNGVTHRIWTYPEAPPRTTEVYRVPDGHLFMMGDNRDGSNDSRSLDSVGYVPLENLVGRAELLFFSIQDASIFEFWNWPTSIRFGRLFTSVT